MPGIRNRQIGLIVDEWGTWHPVEKGTNPAFLYQQNTMRDALVAASTLDIFNRHADKVVMANIAQTVNVLQAMILTEGERMLVTPTGHVYEMYSEHQGGDSLRLKVETGEVTVKRSEFILPWKRDSEPESTLAVVAGSASLKGKKLFLTLTNSHAQDETEVSVELLSGQVNAVSARVLCGEIHAHNTFDRPEQVQPAALQVEGKGGIVKVVLPAASVAAVEIEMA